MRRTIPILAGLAVASSAAFLPAGTSAEAAEGIVELPVAFAVRNTNSTEVPCASDGKDYTVKGHLVAPAAVLDEPGAVTLYLHAVTFGEYYWRFKGVPGYDYAANMAGRGHASVAIDRIGYGESGRPDGNTGTCFGSEADVAHQIVQALRSGNYDVDGGEPVRFSKVFTAGSSVGGMITHIEAYTFGDVDGIINFGWGEERISPYAFAEYNDLMARCAQGGDAEVPFYAPFAKNSKETFYFHSATPEVRAAVPDLNPDPCSQARSIPPAIATDNKNLGQIDVPVLAIFGEEDAIFDVEAAEAQKDRYTGSPEVTLELIADTSHYPLLEATHLVTEEAVDTWLKRHGG